MNFRKFCLITVIALLALPAIAEVEYKYPLWEDYCPKKFLNAKTVTPEEYQQMQKIKFLIPIKKQVNNYNKAVEYWNDRKVKFDKFVTVCANFPEDKQAECFNRIDERETRLNKDLEDRHAKQLKSGERTPDPAAIYLDTTNPLRHMMMRGY